jgi:hypothetical protein
VNAVELDPAALDAEADRILENGQGVADLLHTDQAIAPSLAVIP